MAQSVLRQTVHTSLAKTLYNEVLSRSIKYYFSFGRTYGWGTSGDTPLDVLDTDAAEFDARKNVVFLREISPNDACLVIDRHNWVANAPYDMYDSYSISYPSTNGATSLESSMFYVLTDEFNVYKCLSNNGGAASLVKPTGTQVTPFITSDNYMWKYMYTIPTYLRNKFLTSTQMPVMNAIQNAFYTDGRLEKLVINSKGSRYIKNEALAGTVASAMVNGSTNLRKLYGTNTKFLTASNTAQRLAAGDYIMVNDEVRKIGSVESDTELTIDSSDAMLYVETSSTILKLNTYLEVIGDGYKKENPYIITQINVISSGRYGGTPKIKVGNEWTALTAYALGTQIYYGSKLYTVTAAGTTSSTAPTHSSGEVTNGTAKLTYAGVAAKVALEVGTQEGNPSRGSIIAVQVTTAGSGYTSSPKIYIDAPFIETGKQAEAVVTVQNPLVSSTGVVGSISGAGTQQDPWIATVTGMTSTTGLVVGTSIAASAAVGRLYGGSPDSVAVTAVTTTSVTYRVIGGSTPLEGSVNNIIKSNIISNGSLQYVYVTESGSGYGSDSNITVKISEPLLNGRVAEATPIIVNNAIQTVALTDCGYGYTAIPKVTIEDAGIPNPLNPTQIIHGTDATLECKAVKSKAYIEPVINATTGEISSGRIANGGTGFTYADVVVRRLKAPTSGVTPIDASISANVNPGNLDTQQADVELSAINGGIHVIKIENAGSGYTTATVNIEGDGRGAAANVTVTAGSITAITIVNPGKDYTYANVTITATGSTPTVLATAKAIISPANGHGKSAIDELFGRTIMFFSRLSVEPIKTITVESDYRQICLYKSPKVFGSQLLYNNYFGTSCYKINITASSTNVSLTTALKSGAIVYVKSSALATEKIKFRVIGFKETSRTASSVTISVLLQAIDNNDEEVKAGYVLQSSTNDIFNIAYIEKPDVDASTGEVIYIDNRQPFKALENQPVSVATRFKL